MKVFVFLLGMAAAGMLGYILEPSCRQQLTGSAPSGASTASALGETAVTVTESTPSIDFNRLTPSQLPSSVILKSPLKVNDPQAGTSMTLDPGSRLKPLRVEAGKLVVRAGENGPVFPVDFKQTDLAAQLAANPPPAAETALPSSEPITPFGSPTSPAEPPPAEQPAPPPVETPSSPEEQPAEPTEEPAPTPAPEAAPADPLPPPTPLEPAPSETSGTSTPFGNRLETGITAAMQESIRSGAIKEFTYEQVLDWEEGSEEPIGGTTYQTGIASYKAETIFGTKTLGAKALIKDGKVQRWVWPASGVEVR